MNWKKLLNDGRLRKSTRSKVTDPRNEFESDFGRVIFSPATRRMHDKTQVFPLTEDDNIHSRLTHSMEVMAIGHSLGLRICDNKTFQKKTGLDPKDSFRLIPVVLKNACIVHDIGNPPFGHFGEKVIQKYFVNFFKQKDSPKLKNKREREDFTLFDGNAQGFRVLTKLQRLDDLVGLNLTFATLATYVKYPNTEALNEKLIIKSKRGVFQTEKGYLTTVFKGCGLFKDSKYARHPLAFLMEAADSICYLTMDIEDGASKRWYTYAQYKTFLESNLNVKKVPDLLDHFEKWKNSNEITKLVQLRIFLIAYLVKLAQTNFINNLEKIVAGVYNEELIKDDPLNVASSLFDFCKLNILSNREILSLELTGHSVITGLLDYYIDFLFFKDKDYIM